MTVQNRRAHIVIQGAVQGVGFRPFLYRLAEEMQLPGWVSNTSQGVIVEVEGLVHRLDEFVARIQTEQPPHSRIQTLQRIDLDPLGFSGFEIRVSSHSGSKTALVLPDLATCPDCLRELFDTTNRRYLYPFINCTHCGPRFTIIHSLPYDRPNTSMKSFVLCPECRVEYENPLDRRFHAQPNACPVCGPFLQFWDRTGKTLSTHHDALVGAVQAIDEGRIVAVKGLGGFHLIVDACNAKAVERLRFCKHREEKPFAVMVSHVEFLREICRVSPLEEKLLLSAESPIVLLERRISDSALACEVAPHNPYLGAMLPYTPLHHILLRELQRPIVATSGNRSDEPICIDEREAVERLASIADGFLVHNRPIVRHADDSIVRVMADREIILRRARGYAPLPIDLGKAMPSALAVGAHLKNSIALSVGPNVFISQHIGDLETEPAYHAFREVIDSFQQMYETQPETVVSDLHPDYLSSQFAGQYARDQGIPHRQIQHHYAHVLACMAENQLEGPVLGVSWDGTGYGPDGTIWGGEFLLSTREDFRRVAHQRTFPLPSGDKAIKKPCRTALGLLYECFGETALEFSHLQPLKAMSASDLRLLSDMMRKGLNTPRTSSVGRLFDAVASLAGVRQELSFEGQAAMEFEFALPKEASDEAYPFTLHPSPDEQVAIVDWEPMLHALLEDLQTNRSITECSLRFHNGLVEAIVQVAQFAEEPTVVLTGGCFQNRYLCERAIRRLREEGFLPYWHRHVPPNDGGISLGQIAGLDR